ACSEVEDRETRREKEVTVSRLARRRRRNRGPCARSTPAASNSTGDFFLLQIPCSLRLPRPQSSAPPAKPISRAPKSIPCAPKSIPGAKSKVKAPQIVVQFIPNRHQTLDNRLAAFPLGDASPVQENLCPGANGDPAATLGSSYSTVGRLFHV
ncbi:unnamed protein product, partial [Urochloa humidicola]